MSRDDPSLLSNDRFVLRSGPVRRSDDGAVAVAGDVVRTHELTARDAEVGRHGRRGDESLGTIEGAQTGAAVHASIGYSPISEGKIKTGLRLAVKVLMKDAVCKTEETILRYKAAKCGVIFLLASFSPFWGKHAKY